MILKFRLHADQESAVANETYCRRDRGKAWTVLECGKVHFQSSGSTMKGRHHLRMLWGQWSQLDNWRCHMVGMGLGWHKKRLQGVNDMRLGGEKDKQRVEEDNMLWLISRGVLIMS